MSIGAVLISISVARMVVIPLLSVTHGQYDARPTVTFPACAGTRLMLLGDTGTCVNNMPRVALVSAVA